MDCKHAVGGGEPFVVCKLSPLHKLLESVAGFIVSTAFPKIVNEYNMICVNIEPTFFFFFKLTLLDTSQVLAFPHWLQIDIFLLLFFCKCMDYTICKSTLVSKFSTISKIRGLVLYETSSVLQGSVAVIFRKVCLGPVKLLRNGSNIICHHLIFKTPQIYGFLWLNKNLIVSSSFVYLSKISLGSCKTVWI